MQPRRMISSGGWSTYDLVKYLCSVQGTLTQDELGRLTATRAFPQEGLDAKPGERGQRFAPGDLYEPSDTFRTMGLPVLKWHDTHKWRSNSEEGTCSCANTTDSLVYASNSPVPIQDRLAQVPST